jgi:DNA-binding NtrC family response regulator
MSKTARVLVVCGDNEMCSGLSEWAASWGYHTETASDANEGLQKVSTFNPDIILATEELIPLDGERFLKKAQGEKPRAGLFLFSKYTVEAKSVRLGIINKISTSRLDFTVLRATLQAYLDGRERPSRAFVAHSRIRILIVDDLESQRDFLAEFLAHWNYEIETAEDGLAALEKIATFRPHIVITDLQMPRMNGSELFEKVNAKHPEIGFFIVSAYATIEGAVQAVRSGAIGYIEKPFTPFTLQMQLQAYLDGLQPPLRVFLCHSSEDKSAVRKLYARLRRDRINAWLDEKQLLPGQRWDFEIKKAIRESDVVVVCYHTLRSTKRVMSTRKLALPWT